VHAAKCLGGIREAQTITQLQPWATRQTRGPTETENKRKLKTIFKKALQGRSWKLLKKRVLEAMKT